MAHKYGYRHNWIVDQLPSAAIRRSSRTGEEWKRYGGGFPLGFIHPETNMPYVYNHVNIYVQHHQEPTEDVPGDYRVYRVVGLAVEPMSVKHKFQGKEEMYLESIDHPLETCPTSRHMMPGDIEQPQIVAQGEVLLFTYDVIWERSDVEYSSRWDVYLTEDHLVPGQVHWYSIMNSMVVVLFLSIVVSGVMVRNLRRDSGRASCNAMAALVERCPGKDKKGWKLIHADVFRPPSAHPVLFCAMLGSGIHLGVTALLVMILAVLGVVTPARRGSILNASLLVYVLTGPVAGYVGRRMDAMFHGKQASHRCTLYAATLFPGTAFGMFVAFNAILWILHSAAAAPIWCVGLLSAMWCGALIPLVFLGAQIGSMHEGMEDFCSTTVTSPVVVRPIPTPSIRWRPAVGIALAGILPFVAAWVELFFIMASLWLDPYYSVFGFMLLVYVIVMATCAQVTVLLVYSQLCAENHRWWWCAFLGSGSLAFYMFIYSILAFPVLDAHPTLLVTHLLYVGYTFLMCLGVLLVFGSVGTLTSLWFVRTLYSAVKVDGSDADDDDNDDEEMDLTMIQKTPLLSPEPATTKACDDVDR